MLKKYFLKPLQWEYKIASGGYKYITCETIFGYFFCYENNGLWNGYEVVDDSQRKQFKETRNPDELLAEAKEYYESLLLEALIPEQPDVPSSYPTSPYDPSGRNRYSRLP